MTTSLHLGLVAGAATLLAAAPLATIFARWTWLIHCVVVVALVTAAATALRALRAPVWGPPLAALAALVAALTWLFPSGEEFARVLPTAETVRHFATLLSDARQDVHAYGVPVRDVESLLFLTAFSVGAVAVLVDLLSVGLRRPALAGLPMLAIYSVPVAIHPGSVSPVPFVIGAAGFLWLLVADNVDRVRRFGRRFTGDGRDVAVWAPSPLAAAGRRLSVVGVALAVALPLAVPGMTSGMIDRFQLVGEGSGSGFRAGSGGRVNLFAALSGQLNQTEVRELARVTTTDPAPSYLRFGVADEIRPEGFASRPLSGRPLAEALIDPRRTRQGPGITHHRFQATVHVSPAFDLPMLPTYPTVVAMQDPTGSLLYDPGAQVVYAPRNRQRERLYSFEYVRTSYSPAALRRSLPLPHDDPVRRRFTAVPDEPEVTRLVQRLIAGKRTEYDRVRAIYDYFSRKNGFTYSLRTEGGTSGKDIVNFLNTKVGFCQQYAAAMAWLVRAAGIPARVAFGFTQGTERQDNTVILTNRNLHAWTEVYFAGFGWVPFDPTPAADVPGATRSVWAPDTDAPTPTASAAAPNASSDEEPSATPEEADAPADEVDPALALADSPGGTPRSSWSWWPASALLLVCAAAVPAAYRTLVRRRRGRTAAGTASEPKGSAAASPTDNAFGGLAVAVSDADAARARAHAAWDEFIDTLVDFRVPVDPANTPRAAVEQLITTGRLRDAAAEAGRMLGQAEERARYARTPARSDELPAALRTVRQALAADASRHVRWMAIALPPSVFLRWRWGARTALDRTADTLARWRDGASRRFFVARTPR